MRRSCCAGVAGLLMFFSLFTRPSIASGLNLPPQTHAILDKIYSFDLEGAALAAQHLQQEQPDHPLGYLLEAEALWWRIWCTSADFKYGMSDARRRPKLASDRHYLDLVTRASSVADAQTKRRDSAEMQFYAGMAEASAARLYGLRGENRNAARSGVHAREHFLRAKSLDPDLADSDMGLGLYDYYVDTLSGLAKIMRFFMGIPGGSKQEGVRLLQHAIANGALVSTAARFYLALDLHRYDQQYETALALIVPLTDKYPTNPIFLLARGDLCAKMGRKDQALTWYRAAGALNIQDQECRSRIRELVRLSIAALN